MRKIFLSSIMLAFLYIGNVFALSGSITADIELILKHDETIYPQYPYFGIVMSNHTAPGSCLGYNGSAYFAIHDSDQKAIAMAAYMANRQITVYWNDALKNTPGMCKVYRLDL